MSVVSSRDGAEAKLKDLLLCSAWSTTLRDQIPRLNEDWLKTQIERYETEVGQTLQTGAWRMRWSGKEIFGELSGYVAVGIQSPSLQLAKALGRWQVENDAVPAELLKLRQSLRARVGMEPWPVAQMGS